MFFIWQCFSSHLAVHGDKLQSYTKICCHMPRTKSDFAEQHILVAFHLFLHLSLISTLQSPASWTSSKQWQKTEFNYFGRKKDFLSWNDLHLSLQHLWSWVDWNSLLMWRTKSEWIIRMLDKAPRKNISPQHLQRNFQIRFKALVVILYNFCSPWSHLSTSRTAQHPVFVFSVFVFMVRVELGGED